MIECSKKCKNPKSMRLLFCTLSFIFFSNVFSQQQNSNFVNLPVTPEAAALAKMVNYPINYNTGVPNINIPFYEIQLGSLKLPITLNYHAGGFKINEKSTRTGLGWSLSCDLQITQSVNGTNDLVPGGYISNNLKSYLKSVSYPNIPSNGSYFNESEGGLIDKLYNVASGVFDGMPDKFNYQLLNKTGSFYFQKNDAGTGYTIVTVPYSNIKITYESGGIFKMIDTDGTIYYFGTAGVGDATYLNLKKKELNSYNNEYIVTSWKCDRVISSNKVDEIVFSYVNKTDVLYRSFDDKIEFYNNQYPNIGPVGGNPYHGSMEYPIVTLSNDYDNLVANVPFYQISSPKYKVYHWNKMVFHVPYLASYYDSSLADKTYTKNYANSTFSSVKGISISEINYRGGKVVFSGADKLSSIQVLDDKNNEIKSLNLFQSATTSPQVTDKTEYLDSLHVRNGGNTFERYVLLYNNKFNYGNHLKGHDVFGYPNESTAVLDQYYTGNDDLSMPKKTILMDKFFLPEYDNTNAFATNKTVTIGGSSNWSEAPNEEAMKRGVLRQIIYPTGGSVNFDFETNKYQQAMSSNQFNFFQKLPVLGGGLRIRSINYLDTNSTTLSKQIYYRYGDLEDGTGILLTPPKLTTDSDSYYYGIESYDQTINYVKNLTTEVTCYSSSCLSLLTQEKLTTYSAASSLGYTYPSGAPIYYTKVTEYEHDLGQQTGKTVYTYYRPDEFADSEDFFLLYRNKIPETNIPFLKLDWNIGQQKSKEVFKYDVNNRFKLVHKKSFEYTKYSRYQSLRVVYSFFKSLYELLSPDPISKRDLYNLNFSQNFIEGEYALPMGVMLLSKEKEEWFEETGDKSVSTSYFYDKLPFVQPSIILTTNSKGESIETLHKYTYDFDGVYDEMESENIISPLVEEVSANTTKSKELSRKKTNFEKILEGWNFFAPKTIQSSVNGQSLETDITIDKYDSFANVLQLRGRDNIPVSYLWGYNNLYPIAELKNVLYDAIPSTYTSSIEISNPTNDTSLNSFTNGLRNTFYDSSQKVTTYTYKRQVGVTSTTDAKGDVQNYDYDPIGRLKTIKDKDQKIVKALDYHVKNFTIIDYNNYYNIPMMRSIGYNCETGLFNNYIIPGGKYNQLSSEISNNEALNYLNNVGNNGANFQDDCLPALPYASLELTTSLYNLNQPSNLRNYPNNVEVDFIQEGSIIATQKINITDPFSNPVVTKLFLPQGVYQLSFRIDPTAKYQQGYLPDISITTVENNNKQYLFTGDSFTFEQAKHYKILVANFPR